MSHAVSLLKIHLLQLRQRKYLPISNSGPNHGKYLCLLHGTVQTHLALLREGRYSVFSSIPPGTGNLEGAFSTSGPLPGVNPAHHYLTSHPGNLFSPCCCSSCLNLHTSSFPLRSTELYNSFIHYFFRSRPVTSHCCSTPRTCYP